MKCEKCDKDAEWRINDGMNVFGSVIYVFYCNKHKNAYMEEIEKIKSTMGINLRRPDE
jgi:hypothetical protein